MSSSGTSTPTRSRSARTSRTRGHIRTRRVSSGLPARITRTIRRAGTPVRSGWTIRAAPMSPASRPSSSSAPGPYAFWGSNLTVKAGGTLVLTETGSSKNSTNFDGSDYPPNSYNGGNTASCVNSGAIPTVKITIAEPRPHTWTTARSSTGAGSTAVTASTGSSSPGAWTSRIPGCRSGPVPRCAVGPAIAGRHGRQRIGEPDLDAAGQQRRRGHLRLQHLPGHQPRR